MVVENIEQARFSRLEGINEQVDRRLDDMHSRLDGMHRSINGLRAEVNSRLDGMHQSIEPKPARWHAPVHQGYGPRWTAGSMR